MISTHGLAISLALTDWFKQRVCYDGYFYRWYRKGKSGDIYPDDSILKSILLGKVELVN